MTLDIDSRIKSVMADIFKVSPADISETSNSDKIENWDSLAQLNLLVALEAEFEIEIPASDAVEMLSYGLVRKIVRERMGG